MVVGNWGNPLVTDVDSDAEKFDVSLLTNRDDWLIRSMDEDDTNIGQLSSSQASINLFEGGDLYVEPGSQSVTNLGANAASGTTVDPDTLGGSAEGGETPADATEATAENSQFDSVVQAWLGVSVLTDINFF